MKLYIVKYCANEFDDLGYDSPYPIYYSLDEKKARDFFEDNRKKCIKNFNEFIKNHSEFKFDEDYKIKENTCDYLQYYMGKWFYQYVFDEVKLEQDLRYM